MTHWLALGGRRSPDLAAVRQWIPTHFEVYDDVQQRNLYTLMVAGQSLLAIGDELGATAMFRRILDLHGIQSFRGHDRRYFELAQDSQPPQ